MGRNYDQVLDGARRVSFDKRLLFFKVDRAIETFLARYGVYPETNTTGMHP